MIFEFAAMNEFQYAWFLVFFMEVLVFFWMFFPVMQPNGSVKEFLRSNAGWILLWTAAYLAAKWQLEGYIFLNIFSMLVLGTAGLRLFSDRPLLTALWMAAVFTVCIELGRLLVYGPNYITGDHDFYHRYIWQMRILGQTLKMAFAWYCRKRVCEYSRYRISETNGALIVMAIIQLIFMHYRRQVSAQNASYLQIEMETFFILGAGVMALLAIVNSRISSFLQRMELERIRTAMDANYQEIQRKSELDAEIRRIYHDLKQQIAAIDIPDGSDAGKEKRKLTEELSRQVHSLERVTGTGHVLLDSLLNHKLMAAGERKVHLELFVDTVVYDFIDPMDLCSIMGNAIDNALEAAGKVEESRRFVQVKTALVQGIWVLKVENTFAQKPVMENNVYISSKPGAKREGIGIRSIRYCADKYGGTVDIRTEEDRFILRVMIPVLA